MSTRRTDGTNVRQTPGRHVQCTTDALMSLVKMSSGDLSTSHSAAPDLSSKATRPHTATAEIAVSATTVWNHTWPAIMAPVTWLFNSTTSPSQHDSNLEKRACWLNMHCSWMPNSVFKNVCKRGGACLGRTRPSVMKQSGLASSAK